MNYFIGTFKNKILTLVLAMAAFTLVFSAAVKPAYAVGNATMYVKQVNQMVVGSTLTIQIRVNSDGAFVNTVQSEFTYPTSKLTFLSIEDSSQSAFPISAVATGGSGNVAIHRGTTVSGGIKGDFKVANVNFTVIAAGTADINFDAGNSKLIDAVSHLDVLNTTIDKPITNSNGLAGGDILTPGQFIMSKNGQFKAIMQTDGNFVVYNSLNQPIWYPKTIGKPGSKAKMQTDGNFVVYDSLNSPVWHTTTHGYAGSSAVLQNDGNFVVYFTSGRALWSKTALYNRLGSGQGLASGDYLRSTDHMFRANMQTDGNFVIYNSSNSPLWYSATNGKPGTNAVMQTDGNFVLYNTINAAVFDSATGSPGASMTMQTDGNLVIYSASNMPVWSRY